VGETDIYSYLKAANIQRSSFMTATWDRVEQGANAIYDSLKLGDDLLSEVRQLYTTALDSSSTEFNDMAKRVRSLPSHQASYDLIGLQVAALALELVKTATAIVEKCQDPVARLAIEEALTNIRALW
jgi:hypothetical protein